MTDCARAAVEMAQELGYRSLAMPLLGSGSGGMSPDRSEALICDALRVLDSQVEVLVVRFKKRD